MNTEGLDEQCKQLIRKMRSLEDHISMLIFLGEKTDQEEEELREAKEKYDVLYLEYLNSI